ncbi:MAG: PAS domain-containing protein [Acidimicrobiales bacterium]
MITASEISGRKQAQLDLSEAEARFRSLVQHASDLVAVLDATGIVSWASPSVSRTLHRIPPEDDVRGSIVRPATGSLFGDRCNVSGEPAKPGRHLRLSRRQLTLR